jgi:hypothetical protein
LSFSWRRRSQDRLGKIPAKREIGVRSTTSGPKAENTRAGFQALDQTSSLSECMFVTSLKRKSLTVWVRANIHRFADSPISNRGMKRTPVCVHLKDIDRSLRAGLPRRRFVASSEEGYEISASPNAECVIAIEGIPQTPELN